MDDGLSLPPQRKLLPKAVTYKARAFHRLAVIRFLT